jgi:uncharacterized membrane protein
MVWVNRAVRIVVAMWAVLPSIAYAHTTPGDAHGWGVFVGRLHPVLVHFPVALVLVALLAETMCMIRREGRYNDAARFMITTAAWISIPAAITGFFRAGSITMDAAEQSLFAVHRVAGIATPVLVFLCAGLAEGTRRSGQIWELMLYRVVLVLAAISAAIAGYYGGEIVFGSFPRW